MTGRRYVRNFSRGAEATAAKIRETFTDKPADKKEALPWRWPTRLIEAGECLAVMYRSDKWRRKGDYEDYKHVAEGPQKLFVVPDFQLRDGSREISLAALGGAADPVVRDLFPDSVALLANFLGLHCRLYGVSEPYEVQLSRAKLAAGQTSRGELFLTVYDSSGPQLFVFGAELNIEKDGIVG